MIWYSEYDIVVRTVRTSLQAFFFLFQNDSARVIATLNPQNVGEILNSFQDGIILRNKIKNGS